MNPSGSRKKGKYLCVRSIMLVIKPAYIKTRIFIFKNDPPQSLSGLQPLKFLKPEAQQNT